MGNWRSAEHSGAHHERQVRQAEAVLGLEISFELVAHLGDFGHVGLVDRGDVRGGALGEDHVLGDLAPHGAHGFDAVGGGCAGHGRGLAGIRAERAAGWGTSTGAWTVATACCGGGADAGAGAGAGADWPPYRLPDRAW